MRNRKMWHISWQINKAALVIRGALCHLLGRKLIVFHNFVITIAKHITNFLKRIKDRKRTT